MDIIRRKVLGCGDLKGEKKYQYFYWIKGYKISLRYLEVRGRKFMWETYEYNFGFNNTKLNQRFDTKEEAEEFIVDSLVGDDLKDLVEWKIAKNNIIIQE